MSGMTTETNVLTVGARVRLAEDIDNYPTILVVAGETGTIARVDDESVWVKMDVHLPALDDWKNELEVQREHHPAALVAEEDPFWVSQRDLCGEFDDWIKAQGLPSMSALDLLSEDITPEQREWLKTFIDRWGKSV